MPIYEYRCEACGHTLDALQKISDAPLTDCPECGKSALKKLMSAPSFRLKGGGWYETDFKSDKEKKRNLVESKSADTKDASSTSDSKKESGKSESKKPSKKSGSEAA
jgi:putative FmdB family regulatory protein